MPENIINVDFAEIQKSNMITYYKSLMTERAIADIRDGCKPVHRRILWSMYHSSKAYYDKPHMKGARLVGNALAFHAHGDASVYDAMCRLGQDFVQNICFINAHGAVGDISGSGAAASRYLELRLSKFANLEMFKDIDYNAVNFIPNFDNLDIEPTVLPAPTCNLLINGVSGIAGGFSSYIPCNNINDIGNAIINLIDNPEITEKELAKLILPDYPTGGIIVNKNDAINAYVKGIGNFRLRAKCNIISPSEIQIVEIPYGVTIGPKISSTSTSADGGLLNSIIKKIKDGTIDGIKDIQDHSGKSIDIRIYLKNGFDPNIILKQLYKHTLLEVTQKVIFVCTNNGKFNYYNIKTILQEWLAFRVETKHRVIISKINEAKKRNHIIDGLLKALNNIDDVVKIVKTSKDRVSAKNTLKNKYTLTDLQTNAIIDMKLAQLTNLDSNKLKNEKTELTNTINLLVQSLDEKRIYQSIKDEQNELIKEYGRKRKTELLTEISEDDNDDKDGLSIVQDNECYIVLSPNGYIKRLLKLNIKTQKRNTKGVSLYNKENKSDIPPLIVKSSNRSKLLFFTNFGKVFSRYAKDITEVADIKNNGIIINNVVSLGDDERITKILSIPYDKHKDMENIENEYIVTLSAGSFIKRTNLSEFNKIPSSGLIACKLRKNDELIDALYIIDNKDKGQTILICSTNGKVVRYKLSEIPITERATSGRTGMKIIGQFKALNMVYSDSIKDNILVVNGLNKIKIVPVSDIGITNMFTSGIFLSTIPLLPIAKYNGEENLLVFTKQIWNKIDITDVPISSRTLKGMIMLDIADDDDIKATLLVQ